MSEKTCTCPCDKQTCKGNRKVHFIDVGNMPHTAAKAYIEKIKQDILTAKVDDEQK